MEIYISRKKAICLGSITKCHVIRSSGGLQSRAKNKAPFGSITKCHVIRSSGGLQSRAKNKAPFEKLRLADFSIMGAMVLLEFRFARVLGSLPTTQDGLQGWIG